MCLRWYTRLHDSLTIALYTSFNSNHTSYMKSCIVTSMTFNYYHTVNQFDLTHIMQQHQDSLEYKTYFDHQSMIVIPYNATEQANYHIET